MATIPVYVFNKSETITAAAMSATDEFTLVKNKTSVLIVSNTGASAASISVTGVGVGNVDIPGVGAIDLSAGVEVAIPANATVKVQLNPARSLYLGDEMVNVAGGSADMKAYVLQS